MNRPVTGDLIEINPFLAAGTSVPVGRPGLTIKGFSGAKSSESGPGLSQNNLVFTPLLPRHILENSESVALFSILPCVRSMSRVVPIQPYGIVCSLVAISQSWLRVGSKITQVFLIGVKETRRLGILSAKYPVFSGLLRTDYAKLFLYDP
jgi:hypothetical protein